MLSLQGHHDDDGLLVIARLLLLPLVLLLLVLPSPLVAPPTRLKLGSSE